jgi:hypothetical protein
LGQQPEGLEQLVQLVVLFDGELQRAYEKVVFDGEQ